MSARPPHPASLIVEAAACLDGGTARREARALPEETPVAIVYNGTAQAVMMATPADLEDFAIGFALCDHAITAPDQVREMEIVMQAEGIEARLWFDAARSAAVEARRRRRAGPVGCGLCGIDSLAEALHPVAPLEAGGLRFDASEPARALEALRASQPLHDETHAVHAAGFFEAGAGIRLAREDIGRHNALDKLVGALARAEIGASGGAMVLTARISVDLVQKCAVARAPALFSVSKPTAHAVRLAERAGICLATAGRGGRLDVYTHPDRIIPGARTHVA